MQFSRCCKLAYSIRSRFPAIGMSQLGGLRAISFDTSSSRPPNGQAHTLIQQQTRRSQLIELATEMSQRLRKEQSMTGELAQWGYLIERLAGTPTKETDVGILYMNGTEQQAALIASMPQLRYPNSPYTQQTILQTMSREHKDPSFLAANYGDKDIVVRMYSAANQQSRGFFDQGVFVDWLYWCHRIIIVTDRSRIVRTLTQEQAVRHILEHHPNVCLCFGGLDSNPDAIEIMTDVLQDVLAMAMPRKQNLPQLEIRPMAGIQREVNLKNADAYRSLFMRRPEALQMDLLADAIQTAIKFAASDGKEGDLSIETTDSYKLPPLLEGYLNDKRTGMSPASQRAMKSFAKNDLQSVDASIGEIKQRVRAWFGSSKIWQSLFMRVHETADTLVEDAIADRAMEAAEMGMVHATGRLNEHSRYVAKELVRELLEMESRMYLVDPTAMVLARDGLRAMAQQGNIVEPSFLVQYVWRVRARFMQYDEVLDDIPRQIRWSLAQFWAISGGGVGVSLLAITPWEYAALGSAVFVALALFWLRRCWQQLEQQVYWRLDSQGADLRAQLLEAHKRSLVDGIDQPIRGHLSELLAAQHQQLAATRSRAAANSAVITKPILESWKSRLLSARS